MRLCLVRKNKTVLHVQTISWHEDIGHYTMKSNLEVSHLLEKEKGRVLYMGSLSKMSWDPFLQDCVTWGRTKLSNLRGQSGQYHYMRIWVIIEWEAILESYISLERKGRGLYIWVHYLKCHEAFPTRLCVTWGRIKLCRMCSQSRQYQDIRIWVTNNWY